MGMRLMTRAGVVAAVLVATAAPAAVVTVTNTNGSGVGSLRAAIDYANANPGTTIEFAIPTSDTNFTNDAWFLIRPTDVYTVSGNNTVIDGTSQATNISNTNAAGPEIELSGEYLGGDAYWLIEVTGADCVVKGLSLHHMTGPGLVFEGVSGGQVSDCWFGLRPDGSAASSYAGVSLSNSSGVTVGREGAKPANLLGGNYTTGVSIIGGSGNTVRGCYIGLGPDGTTQRANATDGIYLYDTTNNQLVDNIISGNGSNEVSIGGSSSVGNQVRGNRIGLNANGDKPTNEASRGVLLSNGARANTVGGTVSSDGNLISGTGAEGIRVENCPGGNNRIHSNTIGTNVAGDAILSTSGTGIAVATDAEETTIGASGSGNLIACGVNQIAVTGGSGTVTQANTLGLASDGVTPLSGVTGILVTSASDTTIGGTGAGAGNTIAGQTDGIKLSGSGVNGCTIQGNFVGTTVAGTATAPNTTGIRIESSASNVTVGGSTAGANLISGNTTGVVVSSAGSTTISHNLIGTDLNGTTMLGQGTGVTIGSSGVLVGPDNVISGSTTVGVAVTSGSSSQVKGNKIGTTSSGGEPSAGKQAVGVRVTGVPAANTIGGATASDGNTIAYHSGKGVVIATTTGGTAIRRNRIFANTGLGIDLGDDGRTANDATDADSGPNRLQNFPVLTGAVSRSSDTGVIGSLDSPDAFSTYPIEIDYFASTSGDQAETYLGTASVSMTGELTSTGMAPCGVGKRITAVATDANGNSSEISDATVAIDENGATILVTNLSHYGAGSLREGIRLANLTSSATVGFHLPNNDLTDGVALFMPHSSVLPVTANNIVIDGTTQTANLGNTNPDGPEVEINGSNSEDSDGLTFVGAGCRLKGIAITGWTGEAIQFVSSSTGSQIVDCWFGLAAKGNTTIGNGTSVHVVGAANTTIGGTTVVASTVGILYDSDASGGVIKSTTVGIRPDGETAAGNGSDGIRLDGVSNMTVGVTGVGEANLIGSNGGAGIMVTSSENVQIRNTTIGVTAVNEAPSPNSVGIWTDSPQTVIGGSAAGQGNLISGNEYYGILLNGSTATNCLIQGNTIGTNSAGTAAKPNGSEGISLAGAPANTIGGTAPGAGNLVSGNASNGIITSGAASTANVIQGNTVGTNAAGTAAIPNGGAGIWLGPGATQHQVGGPMAGAGNLISGNTTRGIYLAGNTSSNTLQGNTIGLSATGASLGNAVGILLKDSSGTIADNVIGGSGAGEGNLISGNSGAGVVLEGLDVGDNRVQGNTIGLDPTGTAARPNSTGVQVTAFAGYSPGGNTIGGSTSAAGNLISGNTNDGIAVTGFATSTLVGHNRVGVNASGTAAVANGRHGIRLEDASQNTLSGNLVSGNTSVGISVFNNSSDGSLNLIQNNSVGVDLSGSSAVPNTAGGIQIDAVTDTNTVSGNLVSGNGSTGILMHNSSNHLLDQNTVGLNATGTAALPNDGPGIRLSGDSTSNTLGPDNLIGGNDGHGIETANSVGQTMIQGNTIGVGVGSVAVANNGDGIRLGAIGGAATVGGSSTGQANLIAHNTGNGIGVGAGVGNQLSRNQIRDNGGLGIDLGLDGVTVNDPLDADTGPNNLINMPTIETARSNGSTTTTLTGSLNDVSTSPAFPMTIEFFSNTTADPTTFGEGAEFLDSITVSNPGAFSHVISQALPDGTPVSATVTDADGNTSEFSEVCPVLETAGNVAVVANLNDSGSGSLRAAIGIANNTAGTTIQFKLPPALAVDGVFTIKPATGLPWLSGVGTIINGDTQRAFTGDTNPNGPEIVLDGSLAGGGTAGLLIRVSHCLIQGLVFTNWSPTGVMFTSPAVTEGYLRGCYLGVAADGTTPAPCIGGVSISGFASGVVIGGSSPGQGNLISGNLETGISTNDVSDLTIVGNTVGLDRSGMVSVANGTNGIKLNNATGLTVGGAGSARNLVSGNTSSGIYLGSNSTNNTVLSNTIGLAADGSTARPNGQAGIECRGTGRNTIGEGSLGNLISGNTGAGIVVISGSNANVIQGNTIGLDSSGTTAVGNSGGGILVNSSSNTIGGTSGEHNLVSGNSGAGIRLDGSTATDNLLVGNRIGTNPAGNAALGNGGPGIQLSNQASGNTLGDVSLGETGVQPLLELNTDNRVAGNSGGGVVIDGANANTIGATTVGLADDGSPLPNGGAGGVGILIQNGASNNQIGDADDASLRVVVGSHDGPGVLIEGSGTNANTVSGTYLGTDGSAAKPNLHGLKLTGGDGNLLDRNLVSGNSDAGVLITGANATKTAVVGNTIGLAADGTTALANGGDGLSVADGAANTTIGIELNGVAGNTIAANQGSGIALRSGATGTVIGNNFIGTTSDGVENLGNTGKGVLIEGSAGNTVGGVGRGNVIADCPGDGIFITGATATGNTLIANEFQTIGGIGINLDGGTENTLGVTLNDPGDTDTGPNNLLNFPVLTGARAINSGTQLVVTGVVGAGATVELSRSGGDFGPGEAYLGRLVEGSADDADSGQRSYSGLVNGLEQGSDTAQRFQFTVANTVGLQAGELLTATATLAGDTSEFSGRVGVTGEPASLAFETQPSTTGVGATITPAVRVKVLDANSQPVTSDNTTTVTLSLAVDPNSGSGGSTLQGTLSRHVVDGVATFDDLAVNRTGEGFVLAAAANGVSGGNSAAFNVAAGPPARLDFTTQPVNGVAGQTLAAVEVTVTDAGGNRITTDNSTSVTIAIEHDPADRGRTGLLYGTLTQTCQGGVARFGDLVIRQAGAGFTLRATTAEYSATSNAFTLSPGAPAGLWLAGQPAGGVVDQVLAPLVAEVHDEFGNLIENDSRAITVALDTDPNQATGGTTLGGTVTRNAVGGVATFDNLTLNQLGRGFQLGVSAIGLLPARGNPFDISSGQTSQLRFIVQPSNTLAGQPIAPAVQVELLDSGGRRVVNDGGRVTVFLTDSPSGVTLQGTTTRTPVDGVVTFDNLMVNAAAAGYRLAATHPNVATAANSASFDVMAGQTSQLRFIVQPSNTLAGQPIAPAVQVELLDSGGRRVVNDGGRVTVFLTDSPSGVTLQGTTTGTPVDGVVTFDNLMVNAAASGYRLAATHPNVATAANSAPFDVAPGAPAAATSSLATDLTSLRGDGVSRVTLTTTVRDAFGNPVAGVPAAQVQVTGNPAAGPGSGLTIAGPTTATNALGQTTATATRTLPGPVLFTAAVGGAPVPGPVEVVFRARAVSASNSQVRVEPNRIAADGQDLAIVTVALRDAANQPVVGSPVDDRHVAVTATGGRLAGDDSLATGVTVANRGTATEADGIFQMAIAATQAASYEATVTVDGVALPAVGFSARSFLDLTLPGGIHLASLPFRVDADSLAELAGTVGLRLYRYDAVAGEYVAVTPDTAADGTGAAVIQPGAGFWAQSAVPMVHRLRGEPFSAQRIELPLASGWNLLGNPTLDALPWSLNQVEVLVGGSSVGNLANQSLWSTTAAPYGWVYESAIPGYQLVFDRSRPGFEGVRDQVEPFAGFWFKAQTANVALNWTLPAGRSTVSRAAQEITARDWHLTIEASCAEGIDTGHLFGLSGDLSRALGVEAPPAASEPPAVSLEVLGEGNSRQTGRILPWSADGGQWDLVVTSRSGSEVTLSWPKLLRQLPRGVTVELLDQQSGSRQLLNTSGSYRYQPSRAGEERPFLLRAAHGNVQRSTITAMTATPTRSRGLTLALSLTGPGDLTLTVRGLSGRLVKQLRERADGAGTVQVGWDGTDQNGRKAPAGTYQIEAEVIAANGARSRAVRTVQVQ